MKYEWRSLARSLPNGTELVLIYSPVMHADQSCPGLPVVVSNAEYVRQSALKHGYTHWAPIPYPLPAPPSFKVRI